MAKFIAQVVVLGAQVVSRAFARALRQEYAATQAAAERGQGGSKAQAEANLKAGMTLDEARNILNVTELEPELIKKHFEHLFKVNERPSGSLYLQSKDVWSCGPTRFSGYSLFQQRYFSVLAFNDPFSELNKERFIKSVKQMKVGFVTKKDAKDAAVLIPLCRVKGKPSVLLTTRSVTIGRNKGDVSFPGGMKEISDKDIIGIALRESQEEIGLSSNIEIWTTMPTVPSRTGTINVSPVVAFIGDIHVEDYAFNKAEVENVFTLTLESLCDPKNFYYTHYKRGYSLPVYIVGEFRIWGLTAALLHHVLKCLLPNSYKNMLQMGSIPRLKINS
ncbi:nucleoside diphosphate-linked moiety X motif 8 [Nephila pilipes]|uniref:Nucleoside diphosphate-linked moiety X motif 8 n=1 Tax=Nephila pilipes TaxID=299642 RepID=A0A8X6Q005_NEPPI|nr:nucleoside diphosphate-linked moiety X motif 8 [Nephila pilipes]